MERLHAPATRSGPNLTKYKLQIGAYNDEEVIELLYRDYNVTTHDKMQRNIE